MIVFARDTEGNNLFEPLDKPVQLPMYSFLPWLGPPSTCAYSDLLAPASGIPRKGFLTSFFLLRNDIPSGPHLPSPLSSSEAGSLTAQPPTCWSKPVSPPQPFGTLCVRICLPLDSKWRAGTTPWPPVPDRMAASQLKHRKI